MAVASLILGLIALLGGSFTGGTMGIICGILAIIFGAIGRKDQAHKGMATAGIVLGVLSLIGGILILVICAGATAAAFASM